MFHPLTHILLKKLQNEGYNALRSNSYWGDESPTFIPITVVGEMGDYLTELDGEQHFLVIEEALTIPEEQLFGVVLIYSIHGI